MERFKIELPALDLTVEVETLAEVVELAQWYHRLFGQA